MDSVSSLNPTSQRKTHHQKNWGPYKGVRMRSWGKWVSEIRVPKTGKKIWLGSYDTPEKAARAYDAAKYCIRGEHGPFNFPDNKRPELPEGSAASLSIKEIQAIATNFASSNGSVSPPSLSSLVTQDSVEAPASSALPVSSVTGSAYGCAPTSVTQAATGSIENMQLDDFLLLDVEWINDFF